MKTFWVSMAGDLLHVYIEYQAEHRGAVEQYLQRQYLRNGVWKIPWCAIYTELPANEPGQIVVKAQCGQLWAEVEE